MSKNNSQKQKKRLKYVLSILTLIIVGIYISKEISKHKEYSTKVQKMNSFIEEFTEENLDTSIIKSINVIAESLDTSDIKRLIVMMNDSLVEVEKQNYVPQNSKMSLQIKTDTALGVKYIIESNFTHPSGTSMSIFDSNKELIYRDIYFYYYMLQIWENSREYYENGLLIKKKYSRTSSSEHEDIYSYTLDEERYNFNLYKTTEDFKRTYRIEL